MSREWTGRASFARRADYLAAVDGAMLASVALLVDISPFPALLFAFAAVVAIRVPHARTRLTPLWARDLFVLAGRLAVVVVLTEAIAPDVAVLPLWSVAVSVIVARRLIEHLIKERVGSRLHRTPVAILGAGKIGVKVASTLFEHGEYGLEPIGFIDSINPRERLPLPLLGSAADVERLIGEHQLGGLIVAFGATREEELVDVVRVATMSGLEVLVLPRFFELSTEVGLDDELWGFPVRRLAAPGPARRTWPLKRMFDVVTASLLLTASAPVFAVAAALVKLSSPGPVIFRQKRVGLNGTIFEFLKFRSMTVNGDSDTTWSVDGDQRVTTVGRLLRRTHVDELPQLINVIKGEMSLVGPRPERPFFVDRFSSSVPGYDHRHAVPGGVTGLAQVKGLVGDTSIEERARFDNRYIQSWSLVGDLSIILRTVKTLVPSRSD